MHNLTGGRKNADHKRRIEADEQQASFANQRPEYAQDFKVQ